MTGKIFFIITAIVSVFALVPAASGIQAQQNELDLPAISAFAIGTELNIAGVREIEPDSFNVILRQAQDKGEEWSKSFIQIGLRFANIPPQGRYQKVTVEIPFEWEPSMPLKFARITIVDKGWLDDSQSGERYVIWIATQSTGHLIVQRALWARLCRRAYWRQWSSDPCP